MESSPNDDEIQIIKNHLHIKTEIHDFIDYKGQICVKHWGYEFLIYQTQKIGIWYLSILQNNKTSMHTHFNKDTFIIVISGCAKVELMDQTLILNPMNYLFIPHYKFHSIGSFAPQTKLIEIEVYNEKTTFSDKNDLLRINDIYKRKDNIYQNSITTVSDEKEKYGYFYLDDDFCHEIHSIIFNVRKINSKTQIPNSKDNKYHILLKGPVYDDKKYLREGSILSSLDGLSYLEDESTILSLSSNCCQEDSKIIWSNEQLKFVVEKLHQENKKVILSSGCFDILHVGHIHNLQEAQSFGDTLMVCLSNDEQIKKLKGSTRPINNYEDRINLFKTIKYVDYIILYEESDIQNEHSLGEIMKIVDPYYWVKGSDYSEQEIFKKHPYLKRIKLIRNIPNKSTTNIIKKINEF